MDFQNNTHESPSSPPSLLPYKRRHLHPHPHCLKTPKPSNLHAESSLHCHAKMISRAYPTDTQSKSSDIAATVLAASSPPQILAACDAVESFLHKHTADQTRWFFSITFPTLICKIFGFDESSSSSAAVKSLSPSGWIDIAALSNDSQLAGLLLKLRALPFL